MAPPKKIQPQVIVAPSALSVLSTIACVLLSLAALDAIADVLQGYGLNRFWSILIVLAMSALGIAIWRTVRRRKKAAEHQKWVSGLGNGFAQRLEEARQEAKRWKGR